MLAGRAFGRDGAAFVATAAFAVFLYASISNVFPFLEPWRPALAAAAVAAIALLVGRIGSGLAITWDGWRGAALLAYLAWAALSVSWSVNPDATRDTAAEMIKLGAIYLTIVNVAHSAKRLGILAGAAVLASIVPSVGTIDYWREGIGLVDGYRARWLGVYADPNHLAMSLVAILPAASVLVVSSRSVLMRIGAAAAAGLGVTAIVLSHSRGGALGLLLAMVLFAVTGAKKVRALSVTLALAVGVAVWAPASFWQRTETISDYQHDASAQGRVWAWEVTRAINVDRPLQGVGAGGMLSAWPTYAPIAARRTPLVAHNIFLAALADLGLPGFLFFLLFVAQALAGAMGAARDLKVGPLARALGAGLAGYILCGMISGYALSAHFFFLTALAASAERAAILARKPDAEEAPAWRASQGGVEAPA